MNSPTPPSSPHDGPGDTSAPGESPQADSHAVGAHAHNGHERHNDDLGFQLPAPARLSPSRVAAALAVGVAVLGGAFVLGYLPRHHARAELEGSTERIQNGPLRVQVVSPRPKPGDRQMSLPGSVQPLEQTVLYPRANGYIRKWNVDIGDRVKEGDVLAVIDTPEVDQQIAQARAQLMQASAALMQAKANRGLAETQRDRYRDLAAKGVASQQELDQRQAQLLVDDANVKAAEAAITAQKANVGRLSELKSFSLIVAPFSGQINERTAERGALVSPTSALFKMSSTDPVRVFVQVPQDVAPSVRNDVVAQVSVREYPGRSFTGKVARTSGSLDAATRTMMTEIRVPNQDNALLVGMYAQVSITLPSPRKVVEIPATSLLTDARGVRVATVTADNKLKLVPVVVDRDTGPTVEISQGLEGNERVVKLASAELTDGRAVELVAESAAPAASGSAAPKL